MDYRLDRKSGNRLSSLGFGCMRLPAKLGKPDVDASERLVLEAIRQGVNYFDTAYLYPGSEACLGEVLSRNDLRSSVYLATKLPHAKCHKKADLDALFQTSLERLKTTYVDYYLIHNVTSCSQWQRLCDLGAVEWIARQKRAGRIRQIGFSFHGTLPEFKKMLEAYDWDFCQIQYNYVNEHYQAGVEGLKLAAERNMPVIIMEPLLGGKLADGLPPEAQKVFDEAGDGSAASWGLRWLWNQPEVTVVLSGMNAPEQLNDNVATACQATAGSLTEEQRDVIARAKAAFEQTFKVPCTGCNYCMPCPKGINIPGSFAAYNESFALGLPTGVFHYFIATGVPNDRPRFASDCIGCGACEKKCPQGIAIRDELKCVCKRLQPPGSKMACKVVTKILR